MFSIINFQVRRKSNKFGYHAHEVRVPYPPKTRSKVWKLPVHRKLVFVSNGHVNDYAERAAKEAPKTRPVTALSVAKCNTYKLIGNLTRAEFEFLAENAGTIRNMFEAQAKFLAKQEAQDEEQRSRYSQI